MGETLQLRLLGRPEIIRAGVSVAEALSSKSQAILYYLAVTDQPQTRSTLAALLWGDVPDDAARANLRKALSNLREKVGDYLDLDGQTVAFRPDCSLWIDVVEFRARADGVGLVGEVQRLQEAVALYRGDFLSGYYVRHAPDFETWMLAEQARLREMVIQALHTLAAHHAEQGELPEGIAVIRRLLGLEPWREEAHRQLMLLLARDGQRSAALAQYELCVKVLAEELGVETGPETKAVYERIRAGDLSWGAEKPESKGELSVAPLSPRHNLPLQPTSFIGREQEVAEIRRLLVEEPACRLLTLMGPGGIGKTRLALAAAAEVKDSFPHGVHFAPLASVGEPEIVISALAEALHLTIQAGVKPKTELFNYLDEKQLLLVIDNLEHLLAGVGLLSEILMAAPQVKLLATSRERLNLQEEWSYRVQGLSFPKDASPDTNFESYSAMRLFLERACRAEAGFNLSEADLPHVIRLCQLVDGMPLALELAAPWVRSITCREIVQEIERSLDFLTTSLRNTPERHRSIKAVLEQTWQRLPETEKALLCKLSVFQGGCLREAAIQVTGATLTLLSSLVDKALLRRAESGRYELHELIRQFAAEQLRTIPGDEEVLQALHCAYYTAFLEDQGLALQTNQQKTALAALAADMDNIRAAWRYAVAHKNVQALEKSVLGLWLLGEYGGLLYENELALRQALSTFMPAAEPWEAAAVPEEYESLVGCLLAGLGHLCARRGQLDEGRAFAEQAVLRLRRARPPDQKKEALALLGLGWVLEFQGNHAEARQRGQEGLILFANLGDRRNVADMLLLQGVAAHSEGQLDEAEQLLQQALTVFQEIDERMERGYGVQRLALIAGARGEYARAKRLLDEDLQTRQDFNDVNGMTDLLHAFSRLAIAQGQIAQAEAYIEQGLAICKEAGRLEARGFLGKLGSVRRLQGNYEEAEHFYGESLKSAAAARHQPDLAESLSNLGRLAYDRGEYGRAEQYLRESLALWQQIENEIEIATVLCHLGHVLAALNETREYETRQYYTETLRLAMQQRLAPLALDVFVGAAGLVARGGESQWALELLSLAEHHPAGTYETKEKARRGLAGLAAIWPADMLAASKARSQNLDWQTTTKRLIQELSSRN
ncbi:MAG: tetratricopeptide repeat protein [Anaerolineales bacterium]|nr:tetratricopeptide repeat protein [Anaerolineales bacterium]